MVVELTATGRGDRRPFVAADGRVTIAVGRSRSASGRRASSRRSRRTRSASIPERSPSAAAPTSPSPGRHLRKPRRRRARCGPSSTARTGLKAAAIALHADLTSQEPAPSPGTTAASSSRAGATNPVRLADVAARGGARTKPAYCHGVLRAVAVEFRQRLPHRGRGRRRGDRHRRRPRLRGRTRLRPCDQSRRCRRSGDRRRHAGPRRDAVRGDAPTATTASRSPAVSLIARSAANLPTFHLRHIETPSPSTRSAPRAPARAASRARRPRSSRRSRTPFPNSASTHRRRPYTPSRLLGLIRGHTPLNPERDCP